MICTLLITMYWFYMCSPYQERIQEGGGGAARNFLKGGGAAAHVYVFLILTIMCGYSANLLSIQLRAYIFKWLNYLSLHNNKCCFCLLFSVLVIILTFQLSHVYFFLGIDRHGT